MFLSNNYILSNEIVQKADIHIANISMSIKMLEDSDSKSGISVKYGNCTFLNKEAKNLPHYISEYIHNPEWEFTDFSNKLPVTFLQAELGVSFKLIQEALKNNGFNVEVEEIAGKQFAVFPEDFVEKMRDKTWYVLPEDEYKSCLEEGDIDGGYALNKSKYLTWY